VLRIIITIVLSGKDGKHRKHSVVQSFWIYQIIVVIPQID
jgi:hypothetical protein